MYYGIMSQDGQWVLCNVPRPNTYCLKRWDRNGIPVMRKSPREIDQLMQDFMVLSNNYELSVFEFTKEQEEMILIRRLRGY